MAQIDRTTKKAPAARKRSHDRDCENQCALMGEDERKQRREYQRNAPIAVTGVVADGEGRPEQGMRHPHFGREAEDQRAKTSSRETGVAENDAALGAVGCKCRRQAEQWRHEKQKPVDHDAAVGIAGQLDVGLSGQVAAEIDE